MSRQPRKIGDTHVKFVKEVIVNLLNNDPINKYPVTAIKTGKFLFEKFPNISRVKSKFDSDKPDFTNDLILYNKNDEVVNVNLFLIKKNAKIQTKNPGAKSFLSKYFLSEELQNQFNMKFEEYYKEFLTEIVELKYGKTLITNITELKKMVLKKFPKFTEEIQEIRNKFLYRLREFAFQLLRDSYNNKQKGLLYAYKSFFMIEDVNIVTRYGQREEDVQIEEFNPVVTSFNDTEIYKVGRNTVGIKFGNIGLTLRFKFESGPTSSIKIATSYDVFNEETDSILKETNNNTIEKFELLLEEHSPGKTKNSSNAIGKCHEAITYYYFIKNDPSISQVEVGECNELLLKYYNNVTPEVLRKLYISTATIVPEIKGILIKKYKTYKIKSIELIPDNYIRDKLDTGDIQLLIKVKDEFISEKISLKALARRSKKITTKNPGIGTILGPLYFDIGDLTSKVKEVKAKFEVGEIDHKGSLEEIASELGEKLQNAEQIQLKKGIENLLGKAMMAITFYEENESTCKEHDNIKGIINVFVKNPTPIQNTLSWNNDTEKLSLRVKFSKGQKYGWSSIKLTSEYQIQ